MNQLVFNHYSLLQDYLKVFRCSLEYFADADRFYLQFLFYHFFLPMFSAFYHYFLPQLHEAFIDVWHNYLHCLALYLYFHLLCLYDHFFIVLAFFTLAFFTLVFFTLAFSTPDVFTLVFFTLVSFTLAFSTPDVFTLVFFTLVFFTLVSFILVSFLIIIYFLFKDIDLFSILIFLLHFYHPFWHYFHLFCFSVPFSLRPFSPAFFNQNAYPFVFHFCLIFSLIF